MTAAPSLSTRYVFSAAAVPEPDRLEVLREAVWQRLHQIHLNPRGARPLCSELRLLALPSTHVQHGRMSAAELRRRPCGGGEEHWVLVRYVDGPLAVEYAGGVVDVPEGGAALFSTAEPLRFLTPASRYLCVGTARAELQPLLGGGALPAVLPVPESPALGLLSDYAVSLAERLPATADAALLSASARHLQELMALALRAPGLPPDAAGIAAAQLQRAQTLIATRLAATDCSLTGIAAALRVSPRYVQRLFEREGTSFSRYVREQRLAHAYARLGCPQTLHSDIGRIALDAGFGDLSYFNRCFRQRYQCTPSEVREAARRRLADPARSTRP